MHKTAYCKIKPVVEVEKKIRKRKSDILRAIDLGIGNGRIEAINNKIKVTVKMGYGFRNIDNLIALLMLRYSDLKPGLPFHKNINPYKIVKERLHNMVTILNFYHRGYRSPKNWGIIILNLIIYITFTTLIFIEYLHGVNSNNFKSIFGNNLRKYAILKTLNFTI